MEKIITLENTKKNDLLLNGSHCKTLIKHDCFITLYSMTMYVTIETISYFCGLILQDL